MRTDKVVLYRDRKGEWRWRFVRSNGRTMADSGESYKRLVGAQRAAEHVLGVGPFTRPRAIAWERINANVYVGRLS